MDTSDALYVDAAFASQNQLQHPDVTHALHPSLKSPTQSPANKQGLHVGKLSENYNGIFIVGAECKEWIAMAAKAFEPQSQQAET